MAHWNEAVNISGLHRLYETGGISIQQLAKSVVRRLQNTEAFAISDPELTDIICMFGHIDELSRLKDYNAALESLYDFGNKENRLWIEVEGPQEFDDVPIKIKNPFDEDTKPQFGKPHYHGTNTILGAQGGSEWVNQKFVGPIESNTPKMYFFGHVTGCTCDLCCKERAKIAAVVVQEENIEQWERGKSYRIGDRVRYNNMKFECLISCTSVDPSANSHNRPGDAWKWLASFPAKPLDPSLAFTDRITCETKGKPYPTGRKYKYMSDDEFHKKLNTAEIDPPTIPKDLYTYWKDSEELYQDWLIQRWNNQNLTFRVPNIIN